jgi:hypothetical protein
MSNLTNYMTDMNVNSVRKQIAKKLGDKPFYGTMEAAASVITDMDNFPYNRYFRGQYDSSEPIVFEREAGWRQIHNSCYKVLKSPNKSNYPNHVFEGGCSVTYPASPAFLSKYTDREALQVALNENCVVAYR